MGRTRVISALIAVIALTLTAGCGSAGDQRGGADDDNKPTDTAEDTLTLTDAQGEVTLDTPAETVVAIEWTYAEDLLSLGVTPAGVADTSGYDQWITAGPRLAETEGITDIGTRQEPSLDSIRLLEPDLIITSKLRSEGSYDVLNDIAPTLMFDPYAGDSEYVEMRETLQTIGAAVGREDQASQVLTDLDTDIEAARQRVADAGAEGTEVTVGRGYTTDGAAVIELLTDTTLPGGLLPELGLVNAWTGTSDGHGMSKVDIEGLVAVEEADFVYVAAEDDDIFADELPDNALWQQLDFVAGDRAHALDPGTWYFGGPLSTGQVADEIAAAVTS